MTDHATRNTDPSLAIKRADFTYLQGQEISMRAAERKYGINVVNISKWTKQGFISVIKRKGRSVLLNEADVAYCASVYRAKREFYNGQLSGVSIFERDGSPYRVRNQQLAARRRERRRQKSQSKSTQGAI